MRALAAQERQATRLRQRDVNTGPKDDLDIEWEQLMEAHHQAGYNLSLQTCIHSIMSLSLWWLLLQYQISWQHFACNAG